jgi:hypothetical protein
MNVFPYGGGPPISLSKRDYLAGGGEGDVYVKGSTAYKIYHNVHRAIPIGKIHELAGISDPNVIKPQVALVDKRGTPVGYHMRFVPNTMGLCQLFPKAFRERNSLSHDMMLKLIRKLQGMIQNIHTASVLVVDLNELNFLAAKDFKTLYGIDVDSYQTRSYPATAIMASIRDPQVQGYDFTELSDWFSFAVVSFNMFTGIHPFKGKHPSIKGMENRMTAGISVFDPAVRVPKVVYPFDVIPQVYQNWYRALFVDHKRAKPPIGLIEAIALLPLIETVSGSINLEFIKIVKLRNAISHAWSLGNSTLCIEKAGVFLDQRKLTDAPPASCCMGLCPPNNRPVLAWADKVGAIRLLDARQDKDIPFTLGVEQLTECGDRLYVKTLGQIHEIDLVEIGGRIVAGAVPVANCMENATRFFPGVVVQDMIGEMHLTMFPASKMSYTTKIPELKGYRIVDARGSRNVVMVVGHKRGRYDRLVIRFSSNYKDYDIRVVEGISPMGLNFVALETGVVACITEEETLELFSAKRGNPAVKIINDDSLSGDMELFEHQGKAAFWNGNTLYRLKTK